MKTTLKTSMIKATARERLLGNYGTTIAAIILYRIIAFIALDIVVSTIIPTNLLSYLIYYGATILVSLLLGVFSSGLAYLFMNLVYSQPVSVSDLFQGFKNHPDKAIILQVPSAVMNTLTFIPLQVLVAMRSAQLASPGSIAPSYMALALAITLIVLILNIYVKLTFSQSYYILQDFPEKSAGSILRASMKLMKGRKIKLLSLYISFIPMYILGILACFLPLFWVTAYTSAADAAFYQNIMTASAQTE